MFKLGFKGFLQSIIDRFKYLFSSEDPTPSEFSSKLGLRNIKRIFKKDFKSIRERRLNSIPETVSVVINTKGSPPFFEDILRKYKGQVGLDKIEIIVVDSGSKDNTLNLAAYYGCKIIEIKPEEFKHGRSRNIGIEAASG